MIEAKTVARFYRDYKREHPDSDLTERAIRIACANGSLKCARAGRLILITEKQFEAWLNGGNND